MSKIKAIDGKPVFDAKKGITLHVNKNDVDKADPKEPADCVVARACRRELHAKEVRVHLARVYVRMNEGNWTRYRTPPAMRSEIIAFDRGGAFAPGEYQLQPLPPSEAKGNKRKRPGPRKNRKIVQKRKAPHVVSDVRVGPA